MRAALNPSPRDPAVASVGASASVAVSCMEPTVPLDAKRLMSLGCACRRAGAAFSIHARRLAAEIARGERLDSSEPDESAHCALELEAAAQVLQDLSQDADLLALLPHRARFRDLVRMAEAIERGTVFVPAEPGPVVVVVEQDAAPRSMSLVQRLGRVAHRLPVFRRAA